MKILTGHQRRLLEKIRIRGRNQMTLIRSRQFPTAWAIALEKKGYVWLSTGIERGTYFAAWTGKDPDAPEPAKETATAKEKKPAPVRRGNKKDTHARQGGNKMIESGIRYAVYWNRGSACGGIEKIDYNNIWTSTNEDGWTWNDIGGPFDTYMKDFATKEEAQDFLKGKTKNRQHGGRN